MMPRGRLAALAVATLTSAVLVAAAQAQQPAPADRPFEAGQPLATSPNVKVYGSFRFAESCSYDEARDLYVTPSAGIRPSDDDGYVSLVNPDGSVHTTKWIGANRNGLTLNDPLGSDIMNGMLYLADNNVVRWFSMETGAPHGATEVDGADWFNDIEVADDGTVFASQSGANDGSIPTRLYRISPDGSATIVVEGAPLARANGVALDNDGNVVVVNLNSNEILTFDWDGKLLKTEVSLDEGNDGLVILPDGTMYVSSPRANTIARIPPGGPPELVASGILNAASICYDPTRKVIIAPMNNNNSIAIVDVN